MVKSFFSFLAKEFLNEDDVIEYLFGAFLSVFGMANVFAIFFEKYGLKFDYVYFSAFGALIAFFYTKWKKEEIKEKGLPYKKDSIFKLLLSFCLGVTIGPLFTNVIGKMFLPNWDLWFVAVLIGLYWEKIFNKMESVLTNSLNNGSNASKETIESFANGDKGGDHPPQPGG